MRFVIINTTDAPIKLWLDCAAFIRPSVDELFVDIALAVLGVTVVFVAGLAIIISNKRTAAIVLEVNKKRKAERAK